VKQRAVTHMLFHRSYIYTFCLLLPLGLLSDKDQQESCAVEGKSMYDAVVKFDTYRNLQRHRAVLHAVARLSCLLAPCIVSRLLVSF